MFQQGFMTKWSAFTPIIYRMMERQFVDRFFETGELLISSFRRFSAHEDEERKDSEGRNIICGRGKKQTVFAVTGHGDNAFVLCGSAVKDSQLMTSFGSDAAIQIYDSTAFASAVTRHLPGIHQGFEGFCFYTDGSIECNIGDFEIDQLKGQSQDQNLDLNLVQGHILNMAGHAVFFRKAQRFRHQLEYRLVWIADHTVPDAITIHVPEARKYCTPLYVSDLESREENA